MMWEPVLNHELELQCLEVNPGWIYRLNVILPRECGIMLHDQNHIPIHKHANVSEDLEYHHYKFTVAKNNTKIYPFIHCHYDNEGNEIRPNEIGLEMIGVDTKVLSEYGK